MSGPAGIEVGANVIQLQCSKNDVKSTQLKDFACIKDCIRLISFVSQSKIHGFILVLDRVSDRLQDFEAQITAQLSNMQSDFDKKLSHVKPEFKYGPLGQ